MTMHCVPLSTLLVKGDDTPCFPLLPLPRMMIHLVLSSLAFEAERGGNVEEFNLLKGKLGWFYKDNVITITDSQYAS
jgi:hypothetical protein